MATQQPQVLKKNCSLIGQSLISVISRVKEKDTGIPCSEWSRLQKDEPLERYSREDLCMEFLKLTGESAKDVLALLGKVESLDNVRVLIHESIIQANALETKEEKFSDSQSSSPTDSEADSVGGDDGTYNANDTSIRAFMNEPVTTNKENLDALTKISKDTQNNQQMIHDVNSAGKCITPEEDQTEARFETLLQKLGLPLHYPRNLKLMDVIKIQDYSQFKRFSSVIWVFLGNIMLTNFKARDILIEQQLETNQEFCLGNLNTDANTKRYQYDSRNATLDINPLDLMFVVFKCCSHELRQILAKKLFLCRLAIPFAYPPEPSELPVLGLWSIFPIIIGQAKQVSALECPCYVVSFVRLGELSTSKSKLINEILSSGQYHNTFFNRDCPLGTTDRLVSEGMVEAAWYLPSNDSDDVTLYLNLRGDGLCFDQQLRLLYGISSVIVVMVDISFLEETKNRTALDNIDKNSQGMVLAIDAKTDREAQKKCQQYLTDTNLDRYKNRILTFASNGRPKSMFDIKKELVKGIAGATSEYQTVSLTERLRDGNDVFFSRDDELQEFKEAKKKALSLVERIPYNCDTVKEQVVPLQGKLWKIYSQQLKDLKKSALVQTVESIEKKKDEMKKRRQDQLRAFQGQNGLMKSFIDNLLTDNQSDEEHILFLTYLKLFLNDRSRRQLTDFLNQYQSAWQELKAARDTNETNIKTLEENLRRTEHNLADASFGFEHIIRECGQIYEAIMECRYETSNEQKIMATSLSRACAKLLLLGQPFEVMDGDAANVPLKWVNAVLYELKQIVGDKKLLSLSVLGIQSSGKSTLLNTMFGLQFAVSAGRCTRGVFIQLIPVDREEYKFDYILVVDTEGLRASELAHEKYDHDNKLATFVIGLGDISIINIKGENTSEMKDILQIAVHAFLRLKLANERVNLKQSCVFVHQNVPAPDANDKMMHGRQKLVETLDQMTREAAQQESITNIQSFDQVIEFDSEKDVWYFSDLWVGNPPMAPTNPGYSTNAYELKNTVIRNLATSRDTFLTLTDTALRIKDLWNGIITDDFVFGFKNSLEVKAYSSMEKQFRDVSWEMSKFFIEFILKTAKIQLSNCNQEGDLQRILSEINITLRCQANAEVCRHQNDMDKFVDNSELKDVMLQWIETKKMRLTNLNDTFLASTERDIKKIKDERRVQLLQTTEKTKHEIEINRRARQLASEFKGEKPDKKQMAEKFENMWLEMIRVFLSSLDNTDDASSVQLKIQVYVSGQFPTIVNYLATQQTERQYKHISCLEGSLTKNDFEEEKHFQIHRNFVRKTYGYVVKTFGHKKNEDNKKYKKYVGEITETIFRRIDTKVCEITSQDIQFNVNFVTDILSIINNVFEDHNMKDSTRTNFNLLPPYKALLILHVLPYITTVFTNHEQQYNERHSLKAQLQKYKATAWDLFQNLVLQKTEEIIAAGFFQKVIEEKVADRVSELIPLDVEDRMRSQISNDKYGIMRKVMIYLADTINFKECKDYITDPSDFVRRWLTNKMNEMIFDKLQDDKSEYARFAQIHITSIFREIEKGVQKATQSCIGNSKYSSISWITEFTESLISSESLPISTGAFVHVTQISIKDMRNFEESILVKLKETETKVLQIFLDVNSGNIRWKKNPICEMMDDLWGCSEKCPFCHEPCKYTDKSHTEDHQCIQHRIEGLMGRFWKGTKTLVLEFCNLHVQTDNIFIHLKNETETVVPYKDYKKIYPKWYIQPNPDTSVYWKWILWNHRKMFEKTYEMTFKEIPTSWGNLKKKDVIKSLDK